MEPDVIRMYSSSPPPMEDATEEEDDEFGDFGTFSGVPNSISFSEFETPTTFNQTQALTATSPPDVANIRGVAATLSNGSANGAIEPSRANGMVPSSILERTEVKKVVTGALDISNFNGGDDEVLTNGCANFDVQGSPSSQNSVHCHIEGMSAEENFADFPAFSDVRHVHIDSEGGQPAECRGTEQGSDSEDEDRDTNRTGHSTSPKDIGDVVEDGFSDFAAFSDTEGCQDHTANQSDRLDDGEEPVRTGTRLVTTESPEGSCNTDRGSDAITADCQRDFAQELICTNEPQLLNGVGGANEGIDPLLDAAADGETGPLEEKDTETETETETSFGRPLSTDALEEYGDVSTTGSVPSPPLQGDTATPAEDDEDFGDFGDIASFGGPGFTEFDQPEVHVVTQEEVTVTEQDDDDFGDFNSPKFHEKRNEGEDRGMFADFSVTDSFGNFGSAVVGDGGWSAFTEEGGEGEESWAEFSSEKKEEEVVEEKGEWHQTGALSANEEISSTHQQTASLSSRLEKLFQGSFHHTSTQPQEEQEVVVLPLKILLEPPDEKPEPGDKNKEEQEEVKRRRPCRRWVGGGGFWSQLQDIHEAFGLRYQWGGSHCNKKLLSCLGIDTRNILFTGQKKQPVIVPMYAAGLGMLEPTKEPLKPVSAAEMIASIGQQEKTSSCPSDPAQESVPPVQFDWSSSGLKNPLDASGGSSLLNLDFFGPVEDSGSGSSASIPGMDPELFELTTSKLDQNGTGGSRVADAFARLMSTVEKTSTSTRKPRKEENLSEEAAKVIAALPDLSFMQAKVLMFPATLTPLRAKDTPD
ncbi:aftiphilin a [Pholidichthys leucotaenia]